MNIQFYILTEDLNGNTEKQFVTPEKEELKNAENSIKWGAKEGIVSLIEPIRTSTTYWHISPLSKSDEYFIRFNNQD